MIYRKNVGTAERMGRLIGGGLMVACSLSGLGITPVGLALAASGVVTALTGVFGFCPACAMAGRKGSGGAR